MELNQWEKDNGIEYDEFSLEWYNESKDMRARMLLLEEARPLRKYIMGHPEQERACWIEMYESENGEMLLYQFARDLFFEGGELQKLHLVTKMDMDDEYSTIEQRFTFTRKGVAWFSQYQIEPRKKKLMEKTTITIWPEKPETVFDAVKEAFSQREYFNRAPLETEFDLDPWKLELTNTNGETWTAYGYPDEDINTKNGGLSDIMRRIFRRDDLLLFDGNKDRVLRIEIKYKRETKVKPPKDLFSENIDRKDYIVWHYSETMILDRKSETITIVREVLEGCRVTNTYYAKGEISALLDVLILDPSYFMDRSSDPSEFVDNPLETKKYEIVIDTQKGQLYLLSGSFDYEGLPDAWDDFIEGVKEYIDRYSISEIFNPDLYDQSRRRKDEYTFCNVILASGGKKRWYLADEDIYNQGETVIVPVGRDDHEEVAEVFRVEYYSAEDAPYSIKKIKHIIRESEKEPTLPEQVTFALVKVQGSYKNFIKDVFYKVKDNEFEMMMLLNYIGKYPEAEADDILEYVFNGMKMPKFDMDFDDDMDFDEDEDFDEDDDEDEDFDEDEDKDDE